MRIAESLLALQDGGVVRHMNVSRLGQGVDRDLVVGQPRAVGEHVDVLLLELGIFDDAAGFGIDQENAPGMQASLDFDVLRRNVEHADFRGHHHQAILGHVITRGAQAVAIEHRADHAAVGECDRGWTVPRLHQAAVVFVESLALGVHCLMPAPGLGDHHQYGKR